VARQKHNTPAPPQNPAGQRGVSAIGRIRPACRLFSQDFSRNTIVYLPVN